MDIGRRPARARRWLTQAAEVSPVRERLESGLGAGGEGMGSYSSLEGSGLRGAKEGTSSKCREAVEWTGGEPKGAGQPLLQPSRWTLEQEASNVGRLHRARPTLDTTSSSIQHT